MFFHNKYVDVRREVNTALADSRLISSSTVTSLKIIFYADADKVFYEVLKAKMIL